VEKQRDLSREYTTHAKGRIGKETERESTDLGRTTDEESPHRTVIGRSFGGFSPGEGASERVMALRRAFAYRHPGRAITKRDARHGASMRSRPRLATNRKLPRRIVFPPPSLDTSRRIGFRHSRIVGGRPWSDGKHCNLCRGLEIVQRFRVYDGDGGIRSNTRQGHGCDGDARRGVAYCTRARCRTLETTSRCLSLLLFSYISYHALTLHTLRSTPPSNDGTRCVKTCTRRSVSRRPPAVKFSFSALSSRH
jgi:hypothetical protein